MRFLLALMLPVAAFGATCESLSSLKLPDTTITLAAEVTAGPLTASTSLRDLPAFCRVALTLKPSSDSDIRVEVWLPVSGWNGKLMAVGNGAWAGSISYSAMAEALRRGYATSSTDTGHVGGGGDGSFALRLPEKVVDFAYRSEHEMTVKAKAIIATYYGQGARLSYWNSCSGGGRQGLKEAQRFPDDFDGIIAGAPASNWIGRSAGSLWIAQAMHKDEASYIPPAKYSLIHSAVLQACDASDGVKDGVVEDPTRCKFDPKVLECKGADGSGCLTAPQVEAARKVYASAVNPRTQQIIFPGLELGSELGWATHGGPRPFGPAYDHFRYVVFKDPSWDYRTLNFDSDLALAEKVDNGTINALDANMKAYFARGGKLLQYHGWSDPQISPASSVDYYNSVREAMGGLDKVQDSYRLFMVPGMAHCGGGEGTSTFDMVAALEQWVEHGKAPDQILASRVNDGKVDRTRPLCPYPQVAKYNGSGSIDDATNFTCRMP